MNKLLLSTLLIFAGMPIHSLADNSFVDWLEAQPLSAQDLQQAHKKVENYSKKELKKSLAVAPFHYRNAPTEEKNKTLCTICHGAIPHQESQRKRSFLNQHSRFVSCETCHLNTDGLTVSYRWLAFQAPATGQEIETSKSVHTMAKTARKSVIPRPGARIVPFRKGERWMLFSDHAYAQKVQQKWEGSDQQDKTHLVARLHKNNRKQGLDCNECHSAKQVILDLDYLGADEKMKRLITQNVIADFFQRYHQEDERLRLNQLLR